MFGRRSVVSILTVVIDVAEILVFHFVTRQLIAAFIAIIVLVPAVIIPDIPMMVEKGRGSSMKLRSESYPDRIRRIAQEVSQLRNLYQVDHSVEKLRMIANELEQVLKKTPLKKA